jgi:hypothetical protein
MKLVVSLWVLRYGLQDLLTEITEGLVHAADQKSGYTEDGKRQLINVATRLAGIRNDLRRQEAES